MAGHGDRSLCPRGAPDVVAGAVAHAFAAVGDQVLLEHAQRGHLSEYRRQFAASTLRDMDLHVVYEPDENGWVRATIEEIPQVISCAPSQAEAREMIRDALTEWLAALTSTERATLSNRATRETLTLNVA